MIRGMRGWIALAGLLLLTGCSGGMDSSDPHAAHSDAMGAEGRVIEVVAKEFAFAPASISAKVGEPVTVLLENEGSLEHDWSIVEIESDHVSSETTGASEAHLHGAMGEDAAALHVAAMPKQMGQINFTPTKSGRYRYYCSVPGHAEAGMVGELVVQN